MIDVIIPVYNTPLTDLERCLDSILKQSFNNYKVYIIDDGSNNEVRDYLDSFSKAKDNFIVKHKENAGVSSARNLGIEISDSPYITFVDSYDVIEKDFLAEAYKLITENNLDIIIGGYNEIKNNKIVKTRLSLPGLHIYENERINIFLEKLLSGKTNEGNREIGDCPAGRIYTRLFRRSSLGNLRFNTKIRMSEDTLFMIDYAHQVKRIGIVDRIWYNYYINDYSVSHGTNKEELLRIINDSLNEIIARMNNEKDEVIKEAYQARIDKVNSYMDRIRTMNYD